MSAQIPKAVHISNTLFQETLAQETLDGKRPLEPMQSYASDNGVPLAVIEDTNVSTVPEVHLAHIDFFQCLEGSVEFIVGGQMQGGTLWKDDGVDNQNEVRGETIEGGKSIVLVKGDVIWIPAGVPHLHQTESTARLMIVKVPAEVVKKQDISCVWK